MSFKKVKIDSSLELDCHGYITLVSFESLTITKCFEKGLSDVVLRYIGITECFDLFDRDSMDDFWKEDIVSLGLKHSFHDEPLTNTISNCPNLGKSIGLEYYRLGVLHRDKDLPSSICGCGTLKHKKNGLLHRDGDLPAVIDVNGDIEYWVEGEQRGFAYL